MLAKVNGKSSDVQSLCEEEDEEDATLGLSKRA